MTSPVVGSPRPTLSLIAGKRSDPLSPPCPLCQSYCGYTVRYHNNDVTQGFDLVQCSCSAGESWQALLDRARERASLDVGMQHQTFETYDASLFPQQVSTVREFARHPRGFLVLAGPPGTGKTHLMGAVANTLLRQEQPPLSPGGQAIEIDGITLEVAPTTVVKPFPIYVPVPRLMSWLARAQYERDQDRKRADELRWQELLDAGVLLLDEVGTDDGNPYGSARLYELIDYRYANRRPTVLATNSTSQQLPDRIASRLMDKAITRIAAFKGDDYRKRAGAARTMDPWEVDSAAVS